MLDDEDFRVRAGGSSSAPPTTATSSGRIRDMPAAFAEELLHEAMGRLAARRPVFYNEADLQHSLAWEIHLLRPEAHIRLEVPLVEIEAELRSSRLDLLAIVDGLRLAIELKLPRDTFSFTAPT